MQALKLLPKLKGLQTPPEAATGAELQLYYQTVHLLQLFYLHKWIIHRIFTLKADSDGSGTLNLRELETALGLCQLMDHVGASHAARLSLYSLAIDAKIEQATNSTELEFEPHECVSLYTHVVFEKRQASEICKVFRHHDPQNTGFIDSQSMLQVFEEGELLDATAVVRVQSSNLPPKISLQDFERILSELKQQQAVDVLSPKERALLQLIVIKLRVAESCKTADHDYFVLIMSEIRFLFQMMSWANVIVLSLYHSNGDELDSWLDPYLILFSLIPWLEVLVNMYAASRAVSLRLVRRRCIRLVLFTISLCGVSLLIVEPDFVSVKTARFFASFGTLVIFTRSAEFMQLIETFLAAFGSLWPVFGWTVAVVALYALAGQSIFHNKVVNSEGSAYFESYASALTTCFQIFVGENWSAVMFEASDATTDAAKFYFISFVTIFSLLLAQLIVGLIANIFSKVRLISNPHMYVALQTFFTAIDSQDHDADLLSVLELNCKMLPMFGICGFFNQMQPDDRSALDELSYITTWSEAHGRQEDEDCVPQLLTAFVAEQVDRVNLVQLVDNNPWLEDVVSSNADIPDPKADDSPGVSLPPERAKSWWRVGGSKTRSGGISSR